MHACVGAQPSDALATHAGASRVGCTPHQKRACPCVGTSDTGSQVCDASGTRYSSCAGCPSGGQAGSAGRGSDAAAGSSARVPLSDATSAAPGIWCGVGLPALCDVKTEKCCVRSLEVDACIGLGERCVCEVDECQTLEAYCDGPEDCEGSQVCCGTLRADPSRGSRYTTFECADACSPAQNRPEACHKDEETCPPGLICASSQLLANVQICVDPRTLQR